MNFEETENSKPDMKQNLDISKFLNVENSSDAVDVEASLQMLKEGLHVDVALITNKGSLQAHKSVLASLSPVFKAMFMPDELTTVVDLHHISLDGLELFLVLVYVLNNNFAAPLHEFKKSINEHFDELLRLCCEYEVKRLVPALAANLKFHLTPENCWDYLSENHHILECSVYYLVWWRYMLEHYSEVIESERFFWEMQTNPRPVQLFLRRQFLYSLP